MTTYNKKRCVRRICSLLLAVLTAALLCLPSFADATVRPGDTVRVELYGSELGSTAIKSIYIVPKSRSGKLKLVSIRAHGFDGASIVSTDNGSLIAAFSKNTVLPKGLLLSCEFIAEELGDDEIYFDIRAKAVDSGGEHSVQLSEPAARVYHIGSIEDYDVNGDGEVNAVDLVRLMRIIAGAVSGERGDINGDGVIDTLDLVRLLHAIAVGI